MGDGVPGTLLVPVLVPLPLRVDVGDCGDGVPDLVPDRDGVDDAVGGRLFDTVCVALLLALLVLEAV